MRLPAAGKTSPGIIVVPSTNRVVNAHQLGAVGKRRFYLHLVKHLGDAFHDLSPSQHLAALGPELGHGFPIARSFQNEVGDQRDTLWVVELDPSGQPLAGDDGGERNHQLVSFTWRKIHELVPQPGVRPTTSLELETDRTSAFDRVPREI